MSSKAHLICEGAGDSIVPLNLELWKGLKPLQPHKLMRQANVAVGSFVAELFSPRAALCPLL